MGDSVQESSGHAALEAVKELFSGDGQSKKGRKGQNEVTPAYFVLCCIKLLVKCYLCDVWGFTIGCSVGVDPASSRGTSEIDYKSNIDESSSGFSLS